MKDCLVIKKIKKNNSRIDYEYEINGKWKNYLRSDKMLFIEYQEKIDEVPDSIAVIPLLCNVLPISWLFDLTIKVEAIDKAFYECIDEVRNGYKQMYPALDFKGSIIVENVVENKYVPKRVGTLFSGGVDAFNTLFKHLDEKTVLLTLWGADVKLTDEEGWNTVSSHHVKVAEDYNLDYSFVKTNFRESINYEELSKFVIDKVDDEWWHGFQHGIGILGHTSVLAYIFKFKTVYIASSFAAINKGNYTCASDPLIDNNLKFSSCDVYHDGYEYNRQDKIKNICEYVNNNKEKRVSLRVCWQSSDGDNCCECEKCYRTIFGIIAEKHNPKDFGFDLTKEKRKKMMNEAKKLMKYDYNFRYKVIQDRFLINYADNQIPEDLLWFRDLKIKNYKYSSKFYINELKKIIKKIIKFIRKR